MIAIALACDPKLIIADEPTTALDVTIQAQILELMKQLTHRLDVALIIITHNLGVVARYANRVNVMYAGRIVESGPAAADLSRPAASLHDGAVALGAAARSSAPGTARPGRRPAARSDPARRRLLVPAALPICRRGLRRGAPAARNGRERTALSRVLPQQRDRGREQRRRDSSSRERPRRFLINLVREAEMKFGSWWLAAGSASSRSGLRRWLPAPAEEEAPAKRGGTLTYVIPADAPPSFDGHREGTFATLHSVAPFYSVLIRVNPENPSSTTDFVCDLCTAMPQPTDGGKTYTFKIRDGVKFHDGSPLTAADVAASWQHDHRPACRAC